MDIRHCVGGSITTTDTDLLDAIETELPDESGVLLGAEYEHTRTENDDGSETLRARMTFASDDTEVERNGTVVTPRKAAGKLFQSVVTHDLASRADNWEVRQYRTPEGAVLARDVREWYEANPSEQPVDEDGEPYVPDTFDPLNHVINEQTG